MTRAATARRNPPGDPDHEVVQWLLAGDPSIRWQASQDLCSAPPQQVSAERALVATSGWGARLLSLQDDDGRWAGGLYSPKWTSTTYTLLLLHRLGLPSGDPHALAGCRALWSGVSTWGGGLNLAKTVSQPETCISGMLVLLTSSFGHRDDRVADAVAWLVGQQLADGGWNCETVRRGSQHGSFHTTITVLEALNAYQAGSADARVEAAAQAGRDFFLAHRLFKSHRSGEVVDQAFTRFPFPPQWHFDILRGLEHFMAARATRDARLADGIELLRRRRLADGRWPRHAPHRGRTWFEMEERGPSRWATLRCLRVLQWWDSDQRQPHTSSSLRQA